jgi:proline iminopeptidase
MVSNQPLSEGGLVTGDGIRLHWRRFGHGELAVIVPGSWLLSEPLGVVAPGRSFIYYDMRSRGRSEHVEDVDRLGFDHDVRDLEEVRRYFGLDRVSLIGFSYLGGVVVRYAMRHPDRVEGLILLGAIPPRAPAPYTRKPSDILGPERTRRLQALRERADGEEPSAFCKEYWREMLPLYTATPEAADRLTLDMGCDLRNEQPAAFERVLHQVGRTLESYDWRSDARRLEVPTLVVHGTSDHVAPLEGAREWARALPAARLLEISDAGHLLWAERRERTRQAMRRFLTPT